MAVPMGRRRQHDHDLPPHMHRKVRGGVARYYYGRQSVALGASFPAALRRYAELHGAEPIAGQFSEAAALYVRALSAVIYPSPIPPMLGRSFAAAARSAYLARMYASNTATSGSA
jgi:hypothetical protein